MLKHTRRPASLGSLEEPIGRKPIEGVPRGFAPLVAGKVPTLTRRGGRESDRRKAPVGRGKAKLFPLQRDSGRINLQWSLLPSPKTLCEDLKNISFITEKQMLPEKTFSLFSNISLFWLNNICRPQISFLLKYPVCFRDDGNKYFLAKRRNNEKKNSPY